MRRPPPITNRVRELRERTEHESWPPLAVDRGHSANRTLSSMAQFTNSRSAFRIARLFGVGLEDVFGWKANETPSPNIRNGSKATLAPVSDTLI